MWSSRKWRTYDAGHSVEGGEQAMMNESAEEKRENVEYDSGLPSTNNKGGRFYIYEAIHLYFCSCDSPLRWPTNPLPRLFFLLRLLPFNY